MFPKFLLTFIYCVFSIVQISVLSVRAAYSSYVVLLYFTTFLIRSQYYDSWSSYLFYCDCTILLIQFILPSTHYISQGDRTVA
jgi:uncharacterized membrane protein